MCGPATRIQRKPNGGITVCESFWKSFSIFSNTTGIYANFSLKDVSRQNVWAYGIFCFAWQSNKFGQKNCVLFLSVHCHFLPQRKKTFFFSFIYGFIPCNSTGPNDTECCTNFWMQKVDPGFRLEFDKNNICPMPINRSIDVSLVNLSKNFQVPSIYCRPKRYHLAIFRTWM